MKITSDRVEWAVHYYLGPWVPASVKGLKRVAGHVICSYRTVLDIMSNEYYTPVGLLSID